MKKKPLWIFSQNPLSLSKQSSPLLARARSQSPPAPPKKRSKNSPVSPSLPPPLSAKASEPNLDLYCRFAIIPPRPPSSSSSFGRARNRADDFGVAHFQIRGAIRGGLRADLCADAPQLVPAPAVKAEKREGVGRGVEWHVVTRKERELMGGG